MAPAQVVRWIRQAYPKPVVNAEWLDACCTWVAEDMHLNPSTQTEAFIAEVENQLLESDLRDSTEPGTGLPQNAPAMNNQRLRGTPHILVEVTAITEIGHSAFNLHNVRQARIERADLAGLAQEEGVEDEEGPIPNYPRTMLKLELSDGTVTMPAIEYRSLPGLKLDETPLGFKILLKDVLVRRGVIFLEPKGIVLKGHKNSDRDELRDRDFLHGLLRRMMKPIPVDDQQAENNHENQPPPRPPPASTEQRTTTLAQARPPLREISEPPEPREDAMDMDDDADVPRKRRVPNPQPPPSATSSAPSSTNTLVPSRFFAGSSSTVTAAEASMQRLARVLSPVRGDPIDMTDSSVEDPYPTPIRPPGLSSSAMSITHSHPRPSASLSRVPHNQSGPRSSMAPSGGAGGSSSNSASRAKISYEEFEFDDDDAELDAAFLDEVARVEREALAKNEMQALTVSQAVADSRSGSGSGSGSSSHHSVVGNEEERRSNTPVTMRPSVSIAAASNSARARVSRSHNYQPPQPPQPQVREQAQGRLCAKPLQAQTIHSNMQDVITIEDEEEDDKENVPVPKRRVRRRVLALTEDVIDISD